jgi:hypothetical protein
MQRRGWLWGRLAEDNIGAAAALLIARTHVVGALAHGGLITQLDSGVRQPRRSWIIQWPQSITEMLI